MKRRTLVLIGLAVLAVHVAGLWFLADKRVLPKRAHVPLPTFIAKEAPMVDETTGEQFIYREFTVSTRLAEKPDGASK